MSSLRTLSFIPPQTPMLVEKPPEGAEWLHEVKFDGFRTQLTSAMGGSTPAVGVTTFRVSDGAERRVTEARWTDVRQLSWLPGGSGLVLSAAEADLSPAQIWTLSLPAGESRRVTNDLNTYLGASVTADGSALVTVQTDRVPNVWVAPAGDAARARQITTGSGKFDGY